MSVIFCCIPVNAVVPSSQVWSRVNGSLALIIPAFAANLVVFRLAVVKLLLTAKLLMFPVDDVRTNILLVPPTLNAILPLVAVIILLVPLTIVPVKKLAVTKLPKLALSDVMLPVLPVFATVRLVNVPTLLIFGCALDSVSSTPLK